VENSAGEQGTPNAREEGSGRTPLEGSPKRSSSVECPNALSGGTDWMSARFVPGKVAEKKRWFSWKVGD